MAGRAWRGAGWFVGVGIALVGVTAAGCGAETEVPVAQNRVVSALVEPQLTMGALSLAPASNPAPETTVALADNATLDARLLVITAGGAHAALVAITTTLDYLGTPYDVFDASAGPTMTAGFLAAGDHGRYHGILLDTGDLAVGSASAFSDAEWMALASYEARFGVRRAVFYAVPTAAYGLQSTGGFDVKPRPIAARCTAAGSAVFVGANCAGPVIIDDGWAYGSQATDASTHPLLVDAAGSVYAATRTYADGREALVLTFSQSPTALHTLGLAYGVVSWVTRGLFVGERHVYVSAQLDDFFLPSAIYPEAAGVTYRCTAADLQGVGQLAERASGRPGDRAAPGGVRVQRLRRPAGGPGRADGQGARARADLRLDQPHLGPQGPDVDGVRRRIRGVQQEQLLRRRRPVPLQRREPRHAGNLGARQPGGDARRL